MSKAKSIYVGMSADLIHPGHLNVIRKAAELGEATSERTVSKALSFSASLGKTPIITRDIPGFYVNRILFPLIIQSIEVLESEGEKPINIDKAMRAGAGLPMGPLELVDLIGVDVVVNISESLFERTRDPKYRPPETLRKMLESGRLGKKSGRGFYDYEKSDMKATT